MAHRRQTRRTTTSPAVRRRRTIAGRVPAALITLACGAVAVACGGSSSTSSSSAAPKDAAQQVCAQARRAAAAALHGTVSLKIANGDPANVECRLHGAGTRLDVIAQQSAQAWTQWDTTQVHQLQAYGPSLHPEPTQIPKYFNAPGVLVGWIPAQRMIFATNGTQSKGGSYVTVTVSGKGTGKGRAEVALARAVTLAAIKVAPKGPNLTAPP